MTINQTTTNWLLFQVAFTENLLKLPFTNDSNSLWQALYSELLHIIGLTETKEGSKKSLSETKKVNGIPEAFLEDAIIQLDSLDKISRLDDLTNLEQPTRAPF